MVRVPVQYQQGSIKRTVRTVAVNKKITFQFRSTIIVRCTLNMEAMVTRSHVIQTESENALEPERNHYRLNARGVYCLNATALVWTPGKEIP